MPLRIDAIAEIRWFAQREGGRSGPVRPPFHNCPAIFAEGTFDCRIEVNGPLELGKAHVLGISFLSPELVMPFLEAQKHFELSEGHHVADGRILEVLQR